MERHIAKRLGLPCTVISAPVHVQDFPARYSPQMGYEGANVLFDTWVHPLMMGLEEHLLGMFREDFEFHADAAPSHLGHGGAQSRTPLPAGAVEASVHCAEPAAIAQRGLDPDRQSAGDAVPGSAPVLQAVGMAGPEISAGFSATAQALPTSSAGEAVIAAAVAPATVTAPPEWAEDATRELGKIPFFVRGKARRNTERFALERGLARITRDVLYEAKAHYGR
jgi:light-independent protochlorophyllide reductase subunit B